MSADLVARLRRPETTLHMGTPVLHPANRATMTEAADRIEALEAAIPSEHPRWPDSIPVAIGQRVRFNPADISEPVPYPCAECGDETPEDDLVGGMCCSGVCYGRMVGVLAGATEEASDDDPF